MSKNKQLEYLKALLLGQLTIEAIEDLQNTNTYRHNLKNQGNKFVSMLDDYVKKDYDIVFKNNEVLTNNVMNRINAITEKLCKASVDDLVLMDSLIDKYNENKEWFFENLPTEFKDLK